MTDPLTFENTSPRYGLPLLFAAQAQKEVCVNEAFALLDALLFCAIEGIAAAPPAAPVDGTNWLVAVGGTGSWLGEDGKIACYQSGNWLFISPKDGVTLLNRATGQQILYFGSWQTAVAPAAPTGGATIDAQARSAIVSLIAALQTAGVFPSV